MTKTKIQDLVEKGSLLKKVTEDRMEFYNNKGNTEVEYNGKRNKVSIRDFMKMAGESKGSDAYKGIAALIAKIEREGYAKQDILKYIKDYFGEDEGPADIAVTPEGKVIFDEDEISRGKKLDWDKPENIRELAEQGRRLSKLNENKQYFENKIAQAAALAVTAYFKIGQTVTAEQIIDALLKAEEKFEWDLAIDAFSFLNDQLEKNNLEFLSKVPTISREGLTSYKITGSYEEEYDTDLNGVPLSEDPNEAKKAILNSLLTITGKKKPIDGALKDKDEEEESVDDEIEDIDLEDSGIDEDGEDEIEIEEDEENL